MTRTQSDLLRALRDVARAMLSQHTVVAARPCEALRAAAIAAMLESRDAQPCLRATPNITLSTYAHLFGDAQRAAIDGLGARLERISAAAANGDSTPSFSADGNRMATVASLKEKNVRKNRRSLVEARRLELLTLTLPA